jgi:diguanylate cyclase (GGDEF)-like protein
MRFRSRRTQVGDEPAGALEGEEAPPSFLRTVGIDELTGLVDREQAFKRIEALLQTDVVTVALFDIRGFVWVNHDLGHRAADIALRSVARVIALHASPDDVVARIGGDEFLVARSGTCRQQLDLLQQAVVGAEAMRVVCEVERSNGVRTLAEIQVGLAANVGIIDRLAAIEQVDRGLYGRRADAPRTRVVVHPDAYS